jgi:BMFP domain-containing protein YqiC
VASCTEVQEEWRDAESLVQIERIVTTAVSGAESRLRQEVGEKVEEVKRHSGALYEEMLHRLDLVVEGHQALHQKIDKLEARMEHEFVETRALIELSYRQLQQRVETLEQRVQIIEKRLGLSA